METAKGRKRKTEEVETVKLQYQYQKEWIREVVKSRKTFQKVLKSRGTDEQYLASMYYWVYCVVSGSLKIQPDLWNYEPSMWEYCLHVRMENRFGPFKQILSVKKSKINAAGFGLYAKCRFVTGEAITVICENELKMVERKQKEQKLILGGSCAVAADGFVRNNCNAIVTMNGVIRSTQRIMSGEEILVEFRRDRFHPVMLLDAVIWRYKEEEGSKEKVKGRVDSFKRDEKGNFLYAVKFDDGVLKSLEKAEIDEYRVVE